MYTYYHSKYYSHLLTLQNSSSTIERLSQSIFDAKIDLNPHQVEASLFAFASPLQNGVILADEVGLGKTIEAGLVLCQYWSERKRKIIIIAPASLRKQWSMELKEKFFIDSIIIDGSTFRDEITRGNKNPFIQENKVVITSYPFASRKEEFIFLADFGLSILDEAHKLRNFHKGDKAKQAYKNSKGFLIVTKLGISSYDTEEFLIVTAITNDYKKIDEEVARKLFSLKAKESTKVLMDLNDRDRLQATYQTQKDIILQSNEKINSQHFSNASTKLHKWADDKLDEINKELKETKAKIKELNRQSSTLTQIQEIEKIQLAIKEQEKKRKKIQREIFDIEDEIEQKRDELINELKLAKTQKIEETELFLCEWEIK